MQTVICSSLPFYEIGLDVTGNMCRRMHPYPIDYRCKIGRFPVLASCVTISKPDSLSSGETARGYSWNQKLMKALMLVRSSETVIGDPDHLLDRSPNIGPLISCWELDKFKNC
jgi:hypothetical protein